MTEKTRTCPACGADMTLAGGSFCGACGAPLAPAEWAPPAIEDEVAHEAAAVHLEIDEWAEYPHLADAAAPAARDGTLVGAALPTPMTPAEIALALRRGAWGAGLAGALLCVGASSTWVALGGDDTWQVTVASPSLSDYRIVALLAGLVALACAIRLAAVLRGDAVPASVAATNTLGWVCVLLASGDLIAGGVKVFHLANVVSDRSDSEGLDLFVYPSVTYFVAAAGALALLVTLLKLPVRGLRDLEEAKAAAAASSGYEGCPSCGEQIRAKARLCRFCRYEVEVR